MSIRQKSLNQNFRNELNNLSEHELMQKFKLTTSPLGGYIAHYPCSSTPDEMGQPENSTVLYMVSADNIPQFHNSKSHQQWIYAAGGPQIICIIDTSGPIVTFKTVTLGDPKQKSHVDLAKMAGTPLPVLSIDISPTQWIAAKLPRSHGFSLIVCKSDQGWNRKDFTVISTIAAKKIFPSWAAAIEDLFPTTSAITARQGHFKPQAAPAEKSGLSLQSKL